MKNSAMKTLGLSLAAGTAVALMSSTVMNSSVKKSTKKLAKKAINTFTDIVDSMQSMM